VPPPHSVPTHSAGILLYRVGPRGLEVLLVHPGGPFWAKKDIGAWSIPKGEFDPAAEDGLTAAKRELLEETGCMATGAPRELPAVRQRGGKVVHAWAVEGDWDPAALRSNTFELEWPSGSGVRRVFPEVDRAEWFSGPVAVEKLNAAQGDLVRALARMLGAPLDSDAPNAPDPVSPRVNRPG
jgi:predicted NUDIX family NTP pyrophosphohydrolase